MAKRKAVTPPAQTDLAPRALERYLALLPGLERSGRLEPGERDTLALYCQAWCDWVEAGAHVQKEGRVIVVGEALKRVENPYFAIQREAGRTMERLAQELQLTPASRVAVVDAYPLASLIETVA